nr:MAG: head fiber protein [Bacteriophage sp.]
MRNVTIVESNVEPNKEHLWFYNGKLKWFGPNGWEDVCVCKSPSPSSTTTTTPKPCGFKLINNTGNTLVVTGYGYVNGGISTGIPYVPNGGSVLLAKISEQETITLHSLSNYKLGIIIDGEDKGELSSYNTYYSIPRNIFINANEISVYSVGA